MNYYNSTLILFGLLEIHQKKDLYIVWKTTNTSYLLAFCLLFRPPLKVQMTSSQLFKIPLKLLSSLSTFLCMWWETIFGFSIWTQRVLNTVLCSEGTHLSLMTKSFCSSNACTKQVRNCLFLIRVAKAWHFSSIVVCSESWPEGNEKETKG